MSAYDVGPISAALLDDADLVTVRIVATGQERTVRWDAIKAQISGGVLDFLGNLDASEDPDYPAASKGDAYYVSVAGKVGGASGKSVDTGDLVVANADNDGGDEAAVGTSWFVLEHNLAGALVASENLGDLDDAADARDNLGLGSIATQDADDVSITGGTITGTTVSGLTVTATTGTLTIADGKTLTASNTLTLAGTDDSTLNIGAGGTLGSAAYTASTDYLPSAGGTLTGNLLFTDNTYDIGASGATRPRSAYFTGSVTTNVANNGAGFIVDDGSGNRAIHAFCNFGSARLGLSAGGVLTFASGTDASSGIDTGLTRVAASVLAVRDTFTNTAQTLRIFGDATKYLSAGHDGTNATISASSGSLLISTLPTANPGPGILWNDAGAPAIGT